MRKPIVAGNWKMYKTPSEAVNFIREVGNSFISMTGIDIVICAPFTALDRLGEEVAGKNMALGAQNMHFLKEGAFTGEIAPGMLVELGVKYVIIGHSERRQFFNETDESVNMKVKAALAAGLIPIVCVGEKLAEREAGDTFKIVDAQTRAAFSGVSQEKAKHVVIAYEPIWAIGTGKTATAQDANEVCAHIRQTVGTLYDGETAQAIRIQYGGSVKPENIAELMEQPHIDGALVGGASLQPQSFVALVQAAHKE
jgi:triosephosphate isomerase (TIM)